MWKEIKEWIRDYMRAVWKYYLENSYIGYKD